MPTISRQLASAGIADPGDLKSPSLPGASPGSPTGVWFTGKSRPVRLKIEQPWECKSPHADQSGMSTGQASRACLLNSACPRASGASPRHSAPLPAATARVPTFVPVAQNTERARPKRQVAGESPVGDTNFSRVWFNSRMRPCQGRDDGATPFTRSIFGDVAHQQSARLTCERQRGQHSSFPPFSRA